MSKRRRKSKNHARSPPPDKLPEAIVARRQALYGGKLCEPGDVILIWPALPPKGSGFISADDARALLDGLEADRATAEAVAEFLAAQEGGQA